MLLATLFWDAGGLAKYYTEEVGTETAKVIFSHASASRMLTIPWGYTESLALPQRKRNDERLPLADFNVAVSALRNNLNSYLPLTFLPISLSSSLSRLHSF